MNCKEFDDKISQYIDGELNKDEEKAFLDHSNHCQRCQNTLENTKRMIGSLEDLKHMKAPENLSKNIIQALELEMEKFTGEESRESLEKSTKENVQDNEHENVQKIGQHESDRINRKGWFSKQSPWIKKASLAAVLILIVSSAVILTSDWLLSPIEDDMVSMESVEESALDERVADDTDKFSDSINNEETVDSQDEPGVTAMEEEESEFREESSSEEEFGEEGIDEETPDMNEPLESEEGESTIHATEEENTFGIKYSEWIVLLLGIGVISIVVVLRKNRRN